MRSPKLLSANSHLPQPHSSLSGNTLFSQKFRSKSVVFHPHISSPHLGRGLRSHSQVQRGSRPQDPPQRSQVQAREFQTPPRRTEGSLQATQAPRPKGWAQPLPGRKAEARRSREPSGRTPAVSLAARCTWGSQDPHEFTVGFSGRETSRKKVVGGDSSRLTSSACTCSLAQGCGRELFSQQKAALLQLFSTSFSVRPSPQAWQRTASVAW